MKSAVSLFVCAFLTFAIPTVARAEAGAARPQCNTQIAPGFDRTIPQNAPAFVTWQTGTTFKGTVSVDSDALDPETGVALELRPDPRSGGHLIVPSKPLAASTPYQLTLRVSCPVAVPNEKDERITFRTTGTVPLPTATGEARVALAPGDPSVNGHMTYIDLKPTAELEAYWGVTMLDVWVDGEKWATTLYGVAGNYGQEPGVRRLSINPSSFELWNGVRKPVCTEEIDRVLIKTVSLRPHVAGAETDPAPLDVEVPFDCTKSASASGAGSDPGATNAANVSDGSDGCSASGASAGSGMLILVTLGLASMALRRRRRV
jgi:MYXO-CTERM domain-containing protein